MTSPEEMFAPIQHNQRPRLPYIRFLRERGKLPIMRVFVGGGDEGMKFYDRELTLAECLAIGGDAIRAAEYHQRG